MSDDSEFTYNFTSQDGIINIILAVSAVIQTVLFVYHYCKHDKTSKLPHIHEGLEIFAFIFFIAAIVVSEINTSWNQWMMFDITLDSYFTNIDDKYKYMIEWIGCLCVIIGNITFIWIEYYLDRGIQSPLFLNDISIHNIDINITHADPSKVSLEMIANDDRADLNNKLYWKDKQLITKGPYSCCRHPIYLIWAVWEFGYLLCTGHWFEYLSFTTFIFVEALRIDIIDKSLLYKYGQEYVDYVIKTPMACFPTCIGEYCCNMSLAHCMCCCIECQRFEEKFEQIRSGNVQNQNVETKTVSLLVNDQQQNVDSN